MQQHSRGVRATRRRQGYAGQACHRSRFGAMKLWRDGCTSAAVIALNGKL